MTGRQHFSYRSARSGSLLAGIILVLVSEGIGIHLWLYSRKPWLAWLLTASTLSAIAWLASDYRALGRGAVTVDDDQVHLTVGRRFSLSLPRAAIATALTPTWRDLPEPGMPAAADYINLMKQATPNVLLQVVDPTVIKLPAGRSRTVRRIALHLDDPAAFLAALDLPAHIVR
jgi:hypothetical protein